MATLQEEQSVVTIAQAPTALKQEIDMVSPVIQEGVIDGPAPSQSRDIQSVTTKMETALSMTEKWKLIGNYTVSKSSTGQIDYFDVGMLFMANHCPIPFVIDTSNSEVYYTQSFCKFDVQFKFTIYSSSQQQGALIFAMLPFSSALLDYFNKMSGRDDKLGPLDLTQFQHRIISLGRNTEYIMTVPFMSKFTMHPVGDNCPWSRMIFSVFDQLQCVEGTYDKILLKVETRLVNIAVSGSRFEDGLKMTRYGI